MIAHRGAAESRAQENTCATFERAIAVGADVIELDVRRTRDGVLVCFHDPDLEGVPLERLGMAEARARMRAGGSELNTLAEAIETCRGRCGLNVELKELNQEADALSLLQQNFEPDNLMMQSFYARVVWQLRKRAPHIQSGLLVGAATPSDPWHWRKLDLYPEPRLLGCRARFVAPRKGLAKPAFLARMRRLGLPIHVWTVNEEAHVQRMLAADVDGIITDQAERVLAMRDQHQE